jgi:hypothetical protein
MPPAAPDLRSQLAFRPEWVFDPVPWPLLQFLDKQIIFELARIHLDARKAILAVETKAIDEAQAVLKRAGAAAKR